MYFILISILTIIIVATIVIGFYHLYRVAQQNEHEMKPFTEKEYIMHKRFGKTLVIYYSMNGHTESIANLIAQATNADIYKVETIMPLKLSPLFYLRIRNQLRNGQYPGVNTNIPDLKQYDTIFVGAPVWWYTIATPMLSFLKQVDFQGSYVAPFSTQGSNAGSFFSDFSQKARNIVLLKGESFNNLDARYDNAIQNKVTNWLNQL